MVSMHNTDKKNLKYQPQFALGNVGGQYAYFHDEDESQFTLVDQSRVKAQYQKKFKNVNNVSFISQLTAASIKLLFIL